MSDAYEAQLEAHNRLEAARHLLAAQSRAYTSWSVIVYIMIIFVATGVLCCLIYMMVHHVRNRDKSMGKHSKGDR